MDNWYVVYAFEGTEYEAAEKINNFFASIDIKNARCFVIETEKYVRNGKTKSMSKKYIKVPLFPCYLFIKTELSPKEFLRVFIDFAYSCRQIIRILNYGETNDVALSQEDRNQLSFLLDGEVSLEHSVGYIVGDKIIIKYGPLLGREGWITKVNRHNRTAQIQTEMFGRKISTSVALEIVSKE